MSPVINVPPQLAPIGTNPGCGVGVFVGVCVLVTVTVGRSVTVRVGVMVGARVPVGVLVIVAVGLLVGVLVADILGVGVLVAITKAGACVDPQDFALPKPLQIPLLQSEGPTQEAPFGFLRPGKEMGMLHLTKHAKSVKLHPQLGTRKTGIVGAGVGVLEIVIFPARHAKHAAEGICVLPAAGHTPRHPNDEAGGDTLKTTLTVGVAVTVALLGVGVVLGTVLRPHKELNPPKR